MKLFRIFALLLLCVSLLATVACGEDPSNECTSHVDANGDEKCDTCGAAVPKPECTEHKDEDGNEKCDTCGADVPKPECTEHKDSDANGSCDDCGAAVEIPAREIVLIENKVANFRIVIADGVPSNVYSNVDKLVKQLKGFGVTVESAKESESTKTECEVLVGNVTTRGEEYIADAHKYGAEGYGIEIVGNKILLVGGSNDTIINAITAFKEEVLGISSSTKTLKNRKIKSDLKIEVIQDDYKVKTLTLIGEDLRGFKIAVDKSVGASLETATTLQNQLYVSCGYWLELVDADYEGKAIRITLAEKTGGIGFSATFKEGEIAFTCEYSTAIGTEVSDFFMRKIALAKESSIDFTAKDSYEKNVRDVYYEQFGAKGDGKTDDLLAIIAAHEYANKGGHPVFATPGKTYYIGNNDGANHFKGAIVKTDTTWTGAFFVIDDTEIGTEDLRGSTYARQVPIFRLASEKASISKSGSLLPVTSLPKSSTNIGFAPGEPALVLIVNNTQKNFIRYGVNEDGGQNEKEVVLVDKDGNIDPSTPLMWDYETVTSMTVYFISDSPITVQGGHFTTIYNQADCVYRPYERGIKVTRSNSTVKNVTHLNTDEGETGAPSGGFTVFENANNVLFENIEYDNMKGFYDKDSGAIMGSYEISGHNCTNVVWRGCTQNDFWRTDTAEPERYAKSGGIMGSSFNKRLEFYDCVLSSFDAHCGVQDLIIKDSVFEHINCTGGGTAYLENVEIHVMYQKNAIMLRGDYGSPWRGDFYFINCTLVAEDAHEVALFDASWSNWDFGFDGGAQMPYNVYVENITIDSEIGLTTLKLVEQDVGKTAGSADKPIWTKKVWESTVDGKENLNPYKITEKWVIKDTKGYDYVMPPEFTTKIELSRAQ